VSLPKFNYLGSLKMLRLFIILVSVFAFSKVAVAAEADMNKKPVTEVTKEATDKDATTDKDTTTDKDAMTDAAEDKAAEAKKTK
jgi:hypothetical protein